MIKKMILVIVGIVLLSFGAFLTFEHHAKVCFQGACFQLEVADTDDERQYGLMFRESLAKDKGMVFVFDREAPYKFWMKNTLIPLDMIWLDKDFRVVYIERNTQPCKTRQCPAYGSNNPSLYVLEFNAGTSDRIGLIEGCQVDLKI